MYIKFANLQTGTNIIAFKKDGVIAIHIKWM
jgi:hypothetical protein